MIHQQVAQLNLIGDYALSNDSAIDRCIQDLSSTLELAEALEQELELIHRSAHRRTANQGDCQAETPESLVP